MSNHLKKVELSYDRVAAAFDKAWRRLLEFPASQLCKHYAATIVIESFEELGVTVPPRVIKAIIDSDEEKALEWKRLEQVASSQEHND